MSLPSNQFAHLKVPLESILSATNNFAQENLWGKDDFENHYKGQLLWSGELTEVTARRMNKERTDREQLFWMEIYMLSTLKHKNLVSLVGYCDENDEKIIINRNVPARGMLFDHLCDPMLTWVQRLEICVGVAHALSYIHYDEPRDFSIIHRAIDGSKVLLNDDWEPKLLGFEQSMKIKASQRHHSFHTSVKGVNGYVDPTYLETKRVSHKSDMYSFGIVLLEVVCGRTSIIESDTNKYLVPLATTHYREKRLDEIIDWDLWKQMDSQSFNIFAEIAYDCLNEEGSQRPNIDEIVTRLEKALKLQLEHQKSGWNKEWDEKEQQFWMEISMLSSLKHKNLVSLVGFCDEDGEKIIIYKYETMCSLENYFSDTMMLTWVRRLEICVGLAHALSYIHYDEHRHFSIIHGNIGSDTILLNDNFEPKLSEFRLSIKIEASQRHHSFCVDKVWDMEGYTDPTYIETKSVSHKSDIYSFGIVMFELVCGRKAVINDDQDNKYLAPTAIIHYREEKLEDIVEWNLWKQMDPHSFKVFVETAYDCLNEERSQRPNINEIVTKLQKALELARVNQPIMSLPSNQFAHLKVPLESILSATNNFAQENLWGKDDFENHYKGQLLWSGELTEVTARRFNKERNDREHLFWMEISMLCTLKHKNLLSLDGFCDENDEKIIINRNVPARGMLIDHLCDPMLTWVQRLEICVGVAHALSYIHYDEPRDFSVIHRAIGGFNVLLNDDWEPMLLGFEQSMKIKASQRHHSFHTTVKGVNGYLDPTYLETNRVSHKSDMYSFGIVLLEVLCGRTSIIESDTNKYLVPLATTHYREKRLDEIIDWDLWKQMDSQSFNIFAEIAYDCLNEEGSQRPNIDEIVTRLEKALELQLEHQKAIMSLPSHEFSHLQVPLENILSTTNSFAQENVTYNDAFAMEYKGQLLWSGELINITARRLNKDRKDGEKQFWIEISMLFTLKHKNMVSLVGFCDENDEKIIIIRREKWGSLCNYLSDPMLLTWVRRLKISVGIAHALSYVHYDEQRDFSLIHRNINSSTILINDDWEPKLSSFERSMKIKASQRHQFFQNFGCTYTPGYVDSTFLKAYTINHKSDIYSFGIVLFELLCGMESIIDTDSNKYLAPLALTHYTEKRLDEIIDWDLWKQMDSQSFDIFTETAYDCLNEERSQRPNIDEIVTRLEKAMELQLEHQKEVR
ncbi:kinase-like domain, phloem protein 2-like protein [Tanacetum coccineum]